MKFQMNLRKGSVFLVLGALAAGCQLDLPLVGAPLPVQAAKSECVTIQSELSAGFLVSGTILLADFSEHDSKLMALNPTSIQPVDLPDIPVLNNGGETSPDATMFAYETVRQEPDSTFSSTEVVLNGHGKVKFTFPWDRKWGGFDWLNNRQLVFDYWEGWQSDPPVNDVVDIVIGQHETITPILPNPWLPGGPLMAGLVVWKAVYDPSLSVIGYMRGNEPQQSFVLWDLKNNRELWELNKWSTRTIRPAWTPDGKRLAVAALNQKEDNWDRFELYLVDRDGHAQKWIDIKGYYKDSRMYLNWSPNGRYLAIISSKRPLLILDTLTKQLLDFCLPVHSEGIGWPSWSPDSSQVIVSQYYWSSQSVVLDLNKKQASYLNINPHYGPVGWLADSP